MSPPEQELSVQVGNIDSVHIYDMDICESHQSEIGENLTPQSSSAWRVKLGYQ